MPYDEFTRNECEKLFHQLKSLTYFVSYQNLQDELESMELLRQAMVRLRENSALISRLSDGEKKICAVLLSMHMSYMRLKRKDRPSTEDWMGLLQEEPSGRNVHGIYDLYLTCGEVPFKDRIILIFRAMGLNFQEISDLLHLKMKSVERRYQRGSSKLKRLFPEDANEELIRESLLTYVHKQLDSLEAMANLASYNFSPSYSQSVVDDMMHFRRNYWKKRFFQSPYLLPVFFFLLALLVIIVFLATRPKKARDEIEESSSEETSIAESEEASAEISYSITRQVERKYYSSFQDKVIFIDPQTNFLYLLQSGEKARELMNLSKVIEEHAGIEKIALQEEAIYLAFIDGYGATIVDKPLDLEVNRYWHDAWFENQKGLDATLKKGVIISGVQYKFREK